jgi:hypothetical protein
MADTVSFTIRDHTDEYSSVQLSIPDIDETSWVATNTAVAGIQTAIEALTTGNVARRQLSAVTLVDDTTPANPYAQRELGLRMFAQETVAPFKKFHITVPCPDLTVINVGARDEVDVNSVTVVNALATAIEALALSPEGRDFEFYRAKIVGRAN